MSTPAFTHDVQLAINFDGAVIPYAQFEYTIMTEKRVIDTVAKFNRGYHHLPPRFEFTMQIYQVGDDTAKVVQDKQLEGAEFTLGVAKRTGKGTWAFKSLGFSRCIVNDIRGTGFTAEGLEVLVVHCKALEFSPDGEKTLGEKATSTV